MIISLSYFTILGPCYRQTFETGIPYSGDVLDLFDQIYGTKTDKNVTMLNIGVPGDLVTINTKSYKVSLTDLGNSIGGGLGLYLGSSLLTLLTTTKSLIDSCTGCR